MRARPLRSRAEMCVCTFHLCVLMCGEALSRVPDVRVVTRLVLVCRVCVFASVFVLSRVV